MSILKRVSAGLAVATLSALAIACGGYGSSPTSPTTPTSANGGAVADVTIAIQGRLGAQSYSPNPATMKVGQTVAWRNTDSITHTATGNANEFNTGAISPGSTSAPITMMTAGSFPYHCSIHPSMIGTLNVTQ